MRRLLALLQLDHTLGNRVLTDPGALAIEDI